MRPSLEEVKEYFKNAEEVMCLVNHKKRAAFKNIFSHAWFDQYWADCDKPENTGCLLWDSVKGYATITKYKTETPATHYGKRPDVIDFNIKYNLNFTLGNAVKYIARAGKKKGESKESDLNKAIDCIKRELENV